VPQQRLLAVGLLDGVVIGVPLQAKHLVQAPHACVLADTRGVT
jgi:hypothetical protein